MEKPVHSEHGREKKPIAYQSTDSDLPKTGVPPEPGVVELRSADKRSPKEKQVLYITYGVYILLIVFGIGTGYLLSLKSGISLDFTRDKSKIIKTDKIAGSTDIKTFRDSAIGVIEKGGIDGEGTHRLIRDGGPSQTAFLISSVINLDEYIGKKVKVWGETFAAKKAAWLMDVGKIEIQE